MILLVLSGITGGIVTALVLSQYSLILAATAAPFGGSFFTLAVAVYLVHRNSEQLEDGATAEDETDRMVASLRQVAEEGRKRDEKAAHAVNVPQEQDDGPLRRRIPG